MAVPKKKVSVSRKKKRLNSKKIPMSQSYWQCIGCFNFIKIHRLCSKCIDVSTNVTNIKEQYNSTIL
jgi:ribosomal protein L32